MVGIGQGVGFPDEEEGEAICAFQEAEGVWGGLGVELGGVEEGSGRSSFVSKIGSVSSEIKPGFPEAARLPTVSAATTGRGWCES